MSEEKSSGKSMIRKNFPYPSAIFHNKFIIKLDNNKSKMVWSGGTNFYEGGIFGHSNVAQVMEDAAPE